MRTPMLKNVLLATTVSLTLLALGAGTGFWWASHNMPAQTTPMPETANTETTPEPRVLYWYDPMVPQHKFDQPGPSPFMDMALVPMYAEASDTASGPDTVRIDPAIAQNLGVRLAPVIRSDLSSQIEASGVVGYNERSVTLVQSRSAGFVERVAPLAPGDILSNGALIAEVLVPEWAAVQEEFLALRNLGDVGLLSAARQRMRLSGMPEPLIRQVETSGRLHSRIRITTPNGGVLQELEVRPGMTLMAGQTLARINGIDSVWLEVAVPEAQSVDLRIGQTASARFSAFPGEVLEGQISALLPALNDLARTLRVRIELPNPQQRLRPGLSAQVSLQSGAAQSALRIPTEAVIRTGKRALVILAEENGRYRPVEVTIGAETGLNTVILAGLMEGQQVVASGQFMIDSEASLKGILAPPIEDHSSMQHAPAQGGAQ